MLHLSIYYVILIVLAIVSCDPLSEIKENKRICFQRVNYGSCKLSVYSWFYNVTRRKCQRFLYNMCNGNSNRFYKREECAEFCEHNWVDAQHLVEVTETTTQETQPTFEEIDY